MPPATIHRPWNSVDIRGADGLLYHGRVIDCAEEGLIVDDLGCEAPQLVQFGQVYRFCAEFHPPRVSERMSVNALMRLQLTEPAKWYPGIFLAGEVGCDGSFGLVLVTTPEGTTMEVLPANRIQEHIEPIRSLVRKTDLVKEEVALPSGISSGTPSPGLYKTWSADQHLVDCFNSNNSGVKILATHIDGGILHVLKGVKHFARDYCTFDGQLEGETLLRMLGVKSREYPDARRKRLDNTDAGTVTMSITETFGTMEPEPISNYLLLELLSEVFTYLDGLEQVRLRGVCTKWNDILTAFPVIRTLCVGVPEDQAGQSVVRVKSLCKQWTGRTKIIVNTSCTTRTSKDIDSYLKDDYKPLLCSGRVFRCIAQESHLPQLENVILANVTWNWHKSVEDRGPHFSYFVDHIYKELNNFTSVCRSLVLKNVTVELMKLNFTTLNFGLARLTDTPAIVHISKGRISGELSVEAMWSMMEDSLPPLSDADLGRWLELIQGANNDLIKEVLKVLSEYQSADPRPSNQLRNKQWTAEDLAVIVPSKLSRITLHKVLKISCNEPVIFNFRW